MKFSKIMKERIRRTRVLFGELGYELVDGERNEETYSAAFENSAGFQGGLFIDRDNKFLEIAFTFSFSPILGEFVRQKLEEMLKICYEFGCYLNIQKNNSDIAFSIYSKLYYAGLTYYALKETLRDFKECVECLKEVVNLQLNDQREEQLDQ